MIALVHPEPVATAGLVVLMLGTALFVLALAAARLRNRAAPVSKGRRSNQSLLGIAVQGAAIALVAIGPIVPALPPASPLAIAEAVAIGLLMAACAGLFHWATRTMGRNWAVIAQTRGDHQLVTAGPFAWVRNPIYVGIFAMQLALALAFGHWRALVVGVPLYWLGTWLRVAEEEKLLRAQFGAAYDTYAARVKRFVPGIF